MTWPRAFIAVLALWLLVLGWAVQPHGHRPPRILHTQLLDHPARFLPTLPPLLPLVSPTPPHT